MIGRCKTRNKAQPVVGERPVGFMCLHDPCKSHYGGNGFKEEDKALNHWYLKKSLDEIK